ncbi:MAG: transcriptional repressor NrdR [Acidimicrobiales bacterium]|nr:transcriptional repressor NrdR [Acidimicrobiales bacterium]
MKCRQCDAPDTRVIDSRNTDDGAAVRRRRSCPACEHRFTTFERYEEAPLQVLKRNGDRELFLRSKVQSGIEHAVKGRPVSAEQVVAIVDRVEETARTAGSPVETHALGEAVLDSLKELDLVSAMRFASVYRHFQDLADFERAASELSEP